MTNKEHGSLLSLAFIASIFLGVGLGVFIVFIYYLLTNLHL